jgi:hypothetical protein
LNTTLSPPLSYCFKASTVTPLISLPKDVSVENLSEKGPSVEKTPKPPLDTLSLASPTVPGYTESDLSDSALDDLLADMLPTGHRLKKPLPLTIFFGSSPTVRKENKGSTSASQGIPSSSNADPTWSRGLGFEVSPLKTHSAHRKAGDTSKPQSTPSTTSDIGALRGLKSLARAKI